MVLHRLTSITLGVPDVAASSAFFTELGLSEQGAGWFATRDGGAQLQLVAAPHRTLFRLGVGADDADDLGRISDRVGAVARGSIEEQSDDRLVLREPATGILVEVTVAEPLRTPGLPVRVTNAPGRAERVNVPAPAVMVDEPVDPSNLTHVVQTSPDQPATLEFFTDVMGFEISDAVPGVVAFIRCSELHHNLAIQAGPVSYPHHIAFELDDANDVARGGTRMTRADPQRHTWGLGRHAIGSNWFWYLREPGGTFVEYTADVDRISAQDLYRPKEWSGHEWLYAFGPPTPEEFLEPIDLAELIAAAG